MHNDSSRREGDTGDQGEKDDCAVAGAPGSKDSLNDDSASSHGIVPWEQATTLGSRLIPGSELGRFHIEEFLSRGAMGEVWKAYDPVRSRHVVIKILPVHLLGHSLEIARLKESFERINALQHQHICPVYDLGEDPRCGQYLVMKYIEGQTLAVYRWEVVRQVGFFSLAEVIRVLRPIAEALDYAHAEHIVHRDIKPQNIMVGKDGSNPQLVDFGLAAEIRMTTTRSGQPQSDASGTYPYMAPEQWQCKPQDGRTDQYALAAVAYELLVGQAPFVAPDAEVLRLCVLNDPPPAVPEQPAEVTLALSKALAKEPKERFPSCAAFLDALIASQPATIDSRGHGVSTSHRPPTTPRDVSTQISESPNAEVPSPSDHASLPRVRRSPLSETMLTLVLIGIVIVFGVVYRDTLFKKASSTSSAAPSSNATSAGSPPAASGNSSPSPASSPSGSPVVASPAPSLPSAPTASSGQASSVKNYQGMDEALTAQREARLAQRESQRPEVRQYARTTAEEGDKQFAAGEQHFRDYNFLDARASYNAALDAYQAARMMLQKAIEAKAMTSQLRREVAAAKESANRAGAAVSAAQLWKEAERIQAEAEQHVGHEDFVQGAAKLAAAKDKYAQSRIEAEKRQLAASAEKEFDATVAEPEKSLLDQSGGPAWKTAMDAIRDAKKADDSQQIAQSYRLAIETLPQAREAAIRVESARLNVRGKETELLSLLWPSLKPESNRRDLFVNAVRQSPTWPLKQAELETNAEADPALRVRAWLSIATGCGESGDSKGKENALKLADRDIRLIGNPMEAIPAFLATGLVYEKLGDEAGAIRIAKLAEAGISTISTDVRSSIERRARIRVQAFAYAQLAGLCARIGRPKEADLFLGLVDSAGKRWPGSRTDGADAVRYFRFRSDLETGKIPTAVEALAPDPALGYAKNNYTGMYRLDVYCDLALATAKKGDKELSEQYRRNAVQILSTIRPGSDSGQGKRMIASANRRIAEAETITGDLDQAAIRVQQISTTDDKALALSVLGMAQAANGKVADAQATLTAMTQSAEKPLLCEKIGQAAAADPSYNLADLCVWARSLDDPACRAAALAGISEGLVKATLPPKDHPPVPQ